MKQNQSDNKQTIQEEEYSYPYHYIPTIEDGRFSQVCYWSWGFRYLGGIKVVLDQLDKCSFSSLIDIGCGDGRFLREVSKKFPQARLLGIDYSQRAVQLATAMNPDISYKAVDVSTTALEQRFDAATLIEVLEHIPPDQIKPFIENTVDALSADGCLIITVPHENKRLQGKHYQHFTSKSLLALLQPYFHSIDFIPFDTRSTLVKRLKKLLGGEGKYFIVNHPRILSWFYRLYETRFLYPSNEQRCLRIAVVCRKNEQHI